MRPPWVDDNSSVLLQFLWSLDSHQTISGSRISRILRCVRVVPFGLLVADKDAVRHRLSPQF